MTDRALHAATTPGTAGRWLHRGWPAVVALVTLLGIVSWLALPRVPSGTGPAAAIAAGDSAASPLDANEHDAPRADDTAALREQADASDPPGIAGRLLQDGEPLAFASVQNDDDPPSTAASTADGRFFLPRCTGRNRLVIRGSTVPPGFTFGLVELGEGEHFDVGDIEVPRPGAITGRVLDEAGQPLAGVPVFAALHDAYVYPFEILAEESAPSVATDDDGRFRLVNLLPGTIHLFVDHAEREAEDNPLDAVVDLDSGGEQDVGELVVQRAAPLHGVVRDDQGKAVVDARVMPGNGWHERTHPRRAVPSGADGRFVVRGFGRRDTLTVEATGFAPLVLERIDEAPRPLELRLQRGQTLVGFVPGTGGRPGILRLEPVDRRRRPTSHAIGSDGRFRIEHLAAGSWLVRAWVPGVGHSRFAACELPQHAPLPIDLLPAQRVTVRVVDDDDRPIAGAVVSRRQGEDASELAAHGIDDPGSEAVTNGSGEAVLLLSSPRGPRLWARAKGHGQDSLLIDVQAIPATVTLRLPRIGWLQGEVAAAALRANAHLRVRVRRADQDEGSACDVDGHGRFRSGALPAGTYTVTLAVHDAMDPSPRPPVTSPLPLLATSATVGEAVEVHITAGATTSVHLPAPPIGTLHGRVVAAGAPVRDAIVFATRGGDDDTEYRWPHAPDRRDDRFFARTDADGRFRFLAPQAGTFRLRARHAHGAGWSEPLVVHVPTAGSTVACDLALAAAAIRGRLDLTLLPLAERRAVRVCLYALQDAGSNPRTSVWTEDASKWLQEIVPKVAPDRSGAFAFDCLPAGAWACRVVGDRGILLQQLVHTPADGDIDLGILQPGLGVMPQLPCGLGEPAAVQWHQLVDGHELFLRTVDNSKGNGFAWGVLAPGRYRLRAMSMKQGSASDGTRSYVFWQVDAPVGEPIDIEVLPDGRCTPAAVWPDGVR